MDIDSNGVLTSELLAAMFAELGVEVTVGISSKPSVKDTDKVIESKVDKISDERGSDAELEGSSLNVSVGAMFVLELGGSREPVEEPVCSELIEGVEAKSISRSIVVRKL